MIALWRITAGPDPDNMNEFRSSGISVFFWIYGNLTFFSVPSQIDDLQLNNWIMI